MSLYQPYQRLKFHFRTDTGILDLIAHVIVPVNQAQGVYISSIDKIETPNIAKINPSITINLIVLGSPNGMSMKDYQLIVPCDLKPQAGNFIFSSISELKEELKTEILTIIKDYSDGNKWITVVTKIHDQSGTKVGEVTNTITENTDIEIN